MFICLVRIPLLLGGIKITFRWSVILTIIHRNYFPSSDPRLTQHRHVHVKDNDCVETTRSRKKNNNFQKRFQTLIYKIRCACGVSRRHGNVKYLSRSLDGRRPPSPWQRVVDRPAARWFWASTHVLVSRRQFKERPKQVDDNTLFWGKIPTRFTLVTATSHRGNS